MSRSTHSKLIEKSRAACIAAVEAYNRVSAPYREETFAILMINAWELLLKARIVQEEGGKITSLYELKPRKKKDGTPSKNKTRKMTRSGNPMTIGIEKASNIVSGFKTNKIDQPCLKNIEALLEIRDSATHFVAKDVLLQQKLVEISLAAVRNYVLAAQKWFSVSFSDLNISSIPISFDLDQKNLEAVAKKASRSVTKFLAHMQTIEKEADSETSEFCFAVKVHFDLLKKKTDGALHVNIVHDNADITLKVEEDKLPPGFDWDYEKLTKKMIGRYTDFKQNERYHQIRRPLEKERKYCRERYLDPNKKKSLKRFYNPNILLEFDKHYTAKK